MESPKIGMIEDKDMSKIFGFGEVVAGYEVPVLNEREIRAAAGILFFFALVSFMNSWLLGDFRLTRIFVTAFLIDFIIRVFINPRYSPSMILGRFTTRKQAPEWVGAPQKRFAWAVGLSLAALMFYLIVINSIIGPINLIVCATCLTLMFFESVFGNCLACKIYNAFSKQQAQYCPGGACEVFIPHATQKTGIRGTAIIVAFLALIGFGADQYFPPSIAVANSSNITTATNVTTNKCTSPWWAVAIGHKETWKLHNNCK